MSETALATTESDAIAPEVIVPQSMPKSLPVLSWSKIDLLRKCPLRFRRRYIDRAPEPASNILDRGIGVHEIAEELGIAGQEGREVDLVQVIESVGALLEDEAADDLREIAKHLPERLPGLPSDATDVGYERRFAIDVDGKETEWNDPRTLLRGVFDRVYRENAGELAVVRDTKTSRVIEPPGGQGRLYGWTALTLWQPETAAVFFDYVRYGAHRNAVYTADDVATVPAELHAIREDIERRFRDDAWEPRVSYRACGHCSFRSSCPKFQGDLKPLEIIDSADAAAQAANELLALELRRADLHDRLKTWCRDHGDVDIGEERLGYVASVRESVSDVKKAGKVLKSFGLTDADVFAALSLSKSELTKLITKSIADVKRNEKREAREARMQTLRDAGIFNARTLSTFKRYRPGTDEPDAE